MTKQRKGAVIAFAGLVAIGYLAGYAVALAIFVFTWGNNIERTAKKNTRGRMD